MNDATPSSRTPVRRAARLALLLAAFLALLPAGCRMTRPGDDGGRFVQRELVHAGMTYRYQVFVPARRFRGGALPVVLFLHGSGERGSDGVRQTQSGLGPYLRTHAGSFPALAVFPQSPEGRSWDGEVATMAMAALEAASAEFGGDPARTYLTGLSRGGYGVFELALLQPHRFAALVPICGGITPPGRPELATLRVESLAREAIDPYFAAATRLSHLPIWLFHGARDEVVPPAQSRRLYQAFQATGAGEVRYTEYPEAGHNAWDAAYAEPELWSWLLAQRLPPR
ncbi:prolyl oligopeptidase family serine peptidase [Pseudoxanthomonas mexicana]|uniref:carboxylesterase family protein n=1 Tax=Pseudoxanthomonas mexicana TaxID=128785 RepID=UPI00398B269C